MIGCGLVDLYIGMSTGVVELALKCRWWRAVVVGGAQQRLNTYGTLPVATAGSARRQRAVWIINVLCRSHQQVSLDQQRAA